MRAKPITVPTTFNFPHASLDGELTILPRYGQDNHPLHGHFYIGDNAHPFTGKLENLRIESTATRTGRPANIARDMGTYLAHASIQKSASKAIGESHAAAFATAQCLELWKRWPGIQDDRTLRRARENAQKRLKGSARGLLTYTGTNTDMLDYVSVMLLAGARVEVTDGNLIATGPAWIWRWGQQLAENHEHARVTALMPEARPFTWIVD